VTTASVPRNEQDEIGLYRVATGAGVGLAGALLAIVIPVGFLLIATYDGGGFLSLNQAAFLDATGLLILAGALLFLFSFFLYRRGFAHLRKVDSRFTLASVLCLVGSIGFLLVLVAAIVIVGSSSDLLSCINGHPSQALSCLRSGQPIGAYSGLVGFWLGWLGGVGIVLGLSASSSRFKTREIGWGAALYAILLLALIAPFVALVVVFPGVEFVLVLVPILSLLAPYFVFRGARPIVT
jgi:NADH:ubiquinone oxidoreductase subunit 6 (subunit J)